MDGSIVGDATLTYRIYGTLRRKLIEYGITTDEQFERLSRREIDAYFSVDIRQMIYETRVALGNPVPFGRTH